LEKSKLSATGQLNIKLPEAGVLRLFNPPGVYAIYKTDLEVRVAVWVKPPIS
jgi:hypothetical protein